MSIVDKMGGSECYLLPRYGYVGNNTDYEWTDIEKILKMYQVSPDWQTAQSYGSYGLYGNGTAWTTMTLQVICEPGVSGIFNFASVSHSEGASPTATNYWPVPEVTPVAGVETFSNGGFESGTLAGWTDYINAQVITGTAGSTVFAGTKALQLTVGGAAGSTAAISQYLSPAGAQAQRRQVDQGSQPSPFNQLAYDLGYNMRITSFTGGSSGSCTWTSAFNGVPVNGATIDTTSVSQGWQSISTSNFKR